MATVRVLVKVSLSCLTRNTTGLRVAKLQSGNVSKPYYALTPDSCRANLTHIRQSGPESVPDFQVQTTSTLEVASRVEVAFPENPSI